MKPIPVPDALTEPYWRATAAGELHLQRCVRCRVWQHPPAITCRACRGDDLRFEKTDGRGTVYSFCETNRAYVSAFASEVPYYVALVELEEQPGLRVLANLLTDPQREVTIGTCVEVSIERRGSTGIPQFRASAPLDRG
jgi:uncharacterized OB-fold protein